MALLLKKARVAVEDGVRECERARERAAFVHRVREGLLVVDVEAGFAEAHHDDVREIPRGAFAKEYADVNVLLEVVFGNAGAEDVLRLGGALRHDLRAAADDEHAVRRGLAVDGRAGLEGEHGLVHVVADEYAAA